MVVLDEFQYALWRGCATRSRVIDRCGVLDLGGRSLSVKTDRASGHSIASVSKVCFASFPILLQTRQISIWRHHGGLVPRTTPLASTSPSWASRSLWRAPLSSRRGDRLRRDRTPTPKHDRRLAVEQRTLVSWRPSRKDPEGVTSAYGHGAIRTPAVADAQPVI